jgi:hypothetical protein
VGGHDPTQPPSGYEVNGTCTPLLIAFYDYLEALGCEVTGMRVDVFKDDVCVTLGGAAGVVTWANYVTPTGAPRPLLRRAFSAWANGGEDIVGGVRTHSLRAPSAAEVATAVIGTAPSAKWRIGFAFLTADIGPVFKLSPRPVRCVDYRRASMRHPCYRMWWPPQDAIQWQRGSMGSMAGFAAA